MTPSSPSGRSSFFHPDKAVDKTHLFVSIYNDQPPTAPPPTASQEEPHQSPHHHHRHHAQHHHRWTVLVEQPHKSHHHRLSLHPHSHKDTDRSVEPILFLIGRDTNATSSWACHSRHAERADDETLLGKIHIGDCDARQATTVRIEEVLRARLLPPESDGEPSAEEEEGGRTSEHWIRAAVHALQDGGLVHKFDLDEFMTFARTYVAERAQLMTEEAAEDLAPPVAIEYVPVVVGSEDGGGLGDGKKHGGLTTAAGSSTAVGVKNSKTTTGRRGFWLSWPQSTPNTAGSSARSREASPYGGLM